MLSRIFGARNAPVLVVEIDGKELCRVVSDDIPCELNPVAPVGADGRIEFRDSTGVSHAHDVAPLTGWFYFSIRIHPTLACQVDCIVGDSPDRDPAKLFSEGAPGIRFQPFVLPGSPIVGETPRGQGLFERGLHFSGSVTPGNVLLSCECDACHRSFLIHSFHSGFSNVGYFYSNSGRYTLTVGDAVPGCPAALSVPDPDKLAALEAALPKAPDGSRYQYLNPFRCPHCSAPYIDFETHPERRAGEYYGNYHLGSELIQYEPGRG